MKREHAKILAELAACVARGGHVLVSRINSKPERCSLACAAQSLGMDNCREIFASVEIGEPPKTMPSNIQNERIIVHTRKACVELAEAVKTLPSIGGTDDALVSQRVATIHTLLKVALDAADLAMHQADIRYLTHKDVGPILYQ